MAKEKTNEQPEKVSKETEIARLKAQIKAIRETGSFKALYSKLRKASVSIAKDRELDNTGKKEALASLCQDIVTEFQNETGVSE